MKTRLAIYVMIIIIIVVALLIIPALAQWPGQNFNSGQSSGWGSSN